MKSNEAQAGSAGLDSNDPAVSETGRFIAFESDKADLVPNDTNNTTDVFLRDRAAGTTRRMSLRSNEGQVLGGDSTDPAISNDGRFIVFESDATNVISGDTNGQSDIFVRDRVAGTTRRMSVKSNGAQVLDGGSFNPAISGDGRFVAFESESETLVANDTNTVDDIFVHDRQTGRTTRVNLRSNEAQATGGNSQDVGLSESGRFVVFASDAADLVANDGNLTGDVFMRDRREGRTFRISLDAGGGDSNGVSGSPSISATGRYVAFDSFANNLVNNDGNGAYDVFVHDRQTHTTRRVSITSSEAEASGGDSRNARISATGRFVIFLSSATNLSAADGDTIFDVYLRDRQAGTTRLLSRSTAGDKANSDNFDVRISGDGRFGVWASGADNLVANDTNDADDVFIRGPLS